MMGPVGIPQSVVGRIRSEILSAMKTTEVRAWLEASYHESVGNTPEEFAEALKKSFDLSLKAARAAGLKPE